MKYDSHYSLAVLIPMAIWGGMLPAQAADSNTPDDTKKSETATANDDETMVVTAAAQTLQAPGVSTITAEEIRKHPPARCLRADSYPARRQPHRQLHQRPAR